MGDGVEIFLATHLPTEAPALENERKNQKSKTYRKTNSIEHDCKTTENNRKHAKSRTTAENIAYRTNQLPVRAQEF